MIVGKRTKGFETYLRAAAPKCIQNITVTVSYLFARIISSEKKRYNTSIVNLRSNKKTDHFHVNEFSKQEGKQHVEIKWCSLEIPQSDLSYYYNF